jgi:hypothetical protein
VWTCTKIHMFYVGANFPFTNTYWIHTTPFFICIYHFSLHYWYLDIREMRNLAFFFSSWRFFSRARAFFSSSCFFLEFACFCVWYLYINTCTHALLRETVVHIIHERCMYFSCVQIYVYVCRHVIELIFYSRLQNNWASISCFSTVFP